MNKLSAPVDILVLGSGGREHALVCSLAAAPDCGRIWAAPGNGGTAALATNVALDANNPVAVADFARQQQVGLVVIGPEQPLVNGVADTLRAQGTATFGPGAAGAALEGSKSGAKRFMQSHGLPTAAWSSFNDLDAALAYLQSQSLPIVIKADGLAAGKGVTVAQTATEAATAVRECLDGRFGPAGATVVIEAALRGPECSLLVFTDGRRILPMAPAQDHKRVGEGDTGPNTGGMGVYSPVPIVRADEQQKMLEIMETAVLGLAAEGIDYRGVLYGGFMLTDSGPQLLEFNARFGDPETQVLLPRLQSDLLTVMLAVAAGDISGMELSWSPDWAVSVVLCSPGYPGDYPTGLPISGLAAAAQLPGVTIYQAGTQQTADGQLLTAGGRVLDVTALGSTFAEARERAYAAVRQIEFSGCVYRRDIGERALRGREAWS
ncbi:MAG: phosphoribosylamine--glycine ligase [Actinomycetia bacterium]|nr:phosphoribosylamine--glycine ligase [Actinomycetes bacterium]